MTQANLATNGVLRNLMNIVRIGIVAKVDLVQKRAKVSISGHTSGYLPWLTSRAGAGGLLWHAPAVGEQVLIISPGGDLALGIIAGSLYGGKEQPQDQSAGYYTLNLPEKGGQFQINIGKTSITLDGKMLKINADGQVEIKASGDAQVSAKGKVTVEGKTVSLNGGAGCVTTAHMCHFTGSPHGDGSTTVTAGR